MKSWLAVSVTAPYEYGDALSNFLIEQGATGIEEGDRDGDRQTLKAYFSGERGERPLRRLQRYLKSLQDISPEGFAVRVEAASLPEEDWSRNWKRFFKPVQASSRFVVKPPWSRVRLKRGQIAIDIHPGMAFGTGTHATTRLCMKALERIPLRKGYTVLDMGTGSGILSIAAARLGAREVLGLDADGVAVENARENVLGNRVSEIVRIRKGGIGEIRKEFDVIVANIDVKNLRRMVWPLIRRLKPGSFLVLSGILLKEKEGLLRRSLETGRLRLMTELKEEEWVCLILKKKRSPTPVQRGPSCS
jgi:ribosomal protein L11 methyltransferase